MADLIEREALKLLAQAGAAPDGQQRPGDEPQKKLLQALLEVRTITHGMRQRVRLRLVTPAFSAEEA